MGGGASIEYESLTLEINPFMPGIVNRMLNSLGGIPTDVLEELPTDLTITEGGVLLIGGAYGGRLLYDSISLLIEGSTSSHYVARKTGRTTHLLQVRRLLVSMGT